MGSPSFVEISSYKMRKWGKIAVYRDERRPKEQGDPRKKKRKFEMEKLAGDPRGEIWPKN